MKSCGTCKWFDQEKKQKSLAGPDISICNCPLPAIVIESLQDFTMLETYGTECETYEEKP